VALLGRAKVIAMYNYKGGCGKTTTCLNLGSVLVHELKKKVLFVDCDPQCNLTSFMYPEPDFEGDADSQMTDDDEGVPNGEGPNGAAAAEEVVGTGQLPKVNTVPLAAGELTPQSLDILTSGRSKFSPHIYDFLSGLMFFGDTRFITDENLDKIQRKSLR
jgi:hypothetical protein